MLLESAAQQKACQDRSIDIAVSFALLGCIWFLGAQPFLGPLPSLAASELAGSNREVISAYRLYHRTVDLRLLAPYLEEVSTPTLCWRTIDGSVRS
jgi:hypothetical protein